MSKPLQIGLKYCGGCNPQYDRAALVERFVQKLDGRAVFVRPDAPGLNALLVIAGCRTACVEVRPDPGIPVIMVTDADTAKTALKDLERLAGVEG